MATQLPSSVDRHSLFDCTGLVAVITGGGTGIGLIMARALATNGATVYILGRRVHTLFEAVVSITNLPEGAKVIPIECDISSKPSLEAAAFHVAIQTGYINLLIANAATIGPGQPSLAPRSVGDTRSPLTVQETQKVLWDISMDDIVDVYKLNVAATMFTAVAFLDLLDKGNAKKNVKQTSQVLVTSSIAAWHRDWQVPGIGYTTSKAAVNHLTKSLAQFLLQFRIRVNSIAPGLFNSEMTHERMGAGDYSVEGAIPLDFQPMGRAGKEEEMAGTVLYFASEAGSYCNGSIHVVDGGRLGIAKGASY